MLKTAIVGLGWWGAHIARILKTSKKFELVAGVDPDVKTAEKWARENDCPVLNNLHKALEDENIEGVIIATPHSLHEAQTIAAAEAGKQVFCEKPLALNTQSAARMIEACDKANIVLGLGHERRYEPGIEAIFKLVKTGKLGTILHMEANQSHDRLSALSSDSWRSDPNEAPAAGWTGTGVHLADIMIAMMGPVVEVFAQSADRVFNWPSGEVVSAQLRFSDNTLASISTALATPFYGRVAVYGSKGWAEAREMAHPDDPDIAHLHSCFTGQERQSVQTFEPYDAVKANFEAWADAVAGEGTYRFSDQERFANVALLEAIAKSVKTGKPELVEQFPPG